MRLRAVLPPWLFVGLIGLALAGFADAVMLHESGITGDEPFYVRMASHPGGAHSFPYAYRVLVPWIVHVLPFRHVVSFQALALLAIAVSASVLYVLLTELEVDGRLAAGLALGLAVSPDLLITVLRHGRSVDPEATLSMILGALFIVRRQRVALSVTIVIGVLVKETALFLVPFTYAVWAGRLVDRRALRDTVMVALAPVLAFVALRVGVDAVGHEYIPQFDRDSFLRARVDTFRQVFTGSQLRRLAYTYGPLWILAPLALRSSSFARRGVVLVGVCVLAMTESFDAERVIFLAVPVFYASAALAVNHRRRLAIVAVVLLFAVDVGYAGYMQTHGVLHGLDTTPPSPIPVR